MDIRKFFRPTAVDSADSVSNNSSDTNLTSPSRGVSSNTISEYDQQKQNSKINSVPSDLPRNGEAIRQVYLSKYPKENHRSFRSDWYNRFKWLLYSGERDAAFCYPCMQFEASNSKENTFTVTGFRFWKRALDERGFPRHEKSITHIQAMQKWNEQIQRENTNQTVSTLVSKIPLEQNRYYIKSIAEIVQFIAVNELSFRGDYNLEMHVEEGLFIKLFQYTLKKDKELAQCYSKIKKNACYTSPDIQNEVIDVLTEVVRENICLEIQNADVKYFTLLEDGTRDKNQRENISIGIRYVKDGAVKESLLTITTTSKLDAATFTEKTLEVLKSNGLDANNMLSQCYDGASVMSGKKGGVAARIEMALNKKIPYVHCFNHRLHLIVMKVVSDILILRLFFEQCITFHEFFQHPKIYNIYEGKTIGRLLEQRWTGHLAIAKVILDNFQEIWRVLKDIPQEKFDGGSIAKSLGLCKVMEKLEFRFALVLSHKLLSLLDCANNAFESRTTGLKDAVSITQSAIEQVKQLRSENNYLEILEKADSLLPKEHQNTLEPKRKRKANTKKGFVMTEALPSTSSCSDIDDQKNHLKQQYMETIDLLLAEFERRFDNNEELLTAIADIDQFDLQKLQFLSTLGIALPSKEELSVVKSYLQKTEVKKQDILKVLFEQREAFKETYQLYATVMVFACSTAVNESSFSTLTRVNRPQRYSMSHQRMANLVFLAFESKETNAIDFEVF